MLEKDLLEFSENINALRDFVETVELFLLQKKYEDQITHKLGFGVLEVIRDADDARRRIQKIEELQGKSPDVIFQMYSEESEKFQRKLKDLLGEGLKIKIIKFDKDNILVEFDPPAEDNHSTIKAAISLKKSVKRDELLYQNSLLNLIGIGEWVLCQILRLHFSKFPDAVGVDEKFFSLKNLQEIGSIEDARKCIIDSKIENIMRGSFEDWMKFFKEHVKLSMAYLKDEEKSLKEVFQRRNLLVHNGGVVNAIYVAKVPPALREGLVIGEKIGVNKAYLSNVINLFEKFLILIGSELWKKLEPENEKRSDLLKKISFDHLVKERWSEAESLSYFMKEDKRTPERDQIIGQINYWQAIKWQGRYDEIRKDVERSDFSAKDELFQIFHLALINKVEEFFIKLPKVMEAEKLEYNDLDKWPIFRDIRTHDKYKQFHEQHKVEFAASDAATKVEGEKS